MIKKSVKIIVLGVAIVGGIFIVSENVDALCSCEKVPSAVLTKVSASTNVGTCGNDATMVVKLTALCADCLNGIKVRIVDSAGGEEKYHIVDEGKETWPIDVGEGYDKGSNQHYATMLYSFTQKISSPNTTIWANTFFYQNGCHCCAAPGDESNCPSWVAAHPRFVNGASCYANVNIGGVAQVVSCGGASVPTLNLSASPNLINSGNQSVLTWTTSNIDDHCTATGGWSGSRSISGGTATVTLTSTTTYTLECWNKSGTSTGTKSVTVNVGGASWTPTLTLSASPNTINSGESTVLTWTTKQVNDYCLATNGWTGVRSIAGGTATVTPVSTTTYELECWHTNGVVNVSTGKKSVTVNVNSGPPAPTLTLTSSPGTITAPASSTLTWVTNADDKCTAGGDWSGLKSIAGGTATVTPPAGVATYSLQCQNKSGALSNLRTAIVTVNPCVPNYQCVYSSDQKTCNSLSCGRTITVKSANCIETHCGLGGVAMSNCAGCHSVTTVCPDCAGYSEAIP